jgi:23S rRNA (cytosine1962-C5)-methyltransferase
MQPPCIIFEDEYLLVINKPAGMNTHAPSPFAGEGIYDWLKHREPRWANLAIIHRLDKETSGVIVFGKTPLANRSLTEQFTQRLVGKKYLLLTDRSPKQKEFVTKTKIARIGERYASATNGEKAETKFRVLNQQSPLGNRQLIEAEPLTGRTHQIRVHAAENGFPILGDTLYGGSPYQRVCLHAAKISIRHPATDEELSFESEIDFSADARLALRDALINSQETNAFRFIHGASDQWPGWYIDQLGDFLLSQSERSLSEQQTEFLKSRSISAYHKILNRQIRTTTGETSPQLVLGEPAPARFTVRENGLQFELSFIEGYSVGLFLDQRDNRRRLLAGHIAADFPLRSSEFLSSNFEVLNCFAYTCGFSVCAAKAGARVTSLDLSKKYLEWGKRNFVLNGLDPSRHDFIFGDVFDWLRRLAKKQRKFDAILLDPPTFSQSKEHGAFRVEKDFGKLVAAALSVLKPEGVLFSSSNAAGWSPEDFLESITDAIRNSGGKILQQHYVPQPPDFPISRNEPAYLKTVWMRIA